MKQVCIYELDILAITEQDQQSKIILFDAGY